MKAILDREAITQAICQDKVLKRSLGVHPRFTATKWFAAIWAVWMAMLFVTPLPEAVMLNRVSLLLTAILLAIFLGMDALRNKQREAHLAERLYNLLEKTPALSIRQKAEAAGIAHVSHPKFEADCEFDTALLLEEMIVSERDTMQMLEKLRSPGAPQALSATEEQPGTKEGEGDGESDTRNRLADRDTQ